jgi:hypothetical protein
MSIDHKFHMTEHSFVVVPTVVLTRQTCDNPHCGVVHGFSIEIVAFCFSYSLDFTFEP